MSPRKLCSTQVLLSFFVGVYLDIVTVYLIQDDIIIFNTATVSEIIHDAKQFGFDVQGTV